MTVIIIIILAVLGAALGSFFNVLIYRLPRKQSIVFPGSHCGDCGKAIPFYLNIPILSYIALRGKCKYCGASFHWHHLLVEIITPVILIALFLQYGFWNFLFYKYALLCLVLIPIFFIDALHQIIPHTLSIPLIVLGILSALMPQNDITLLNSVVTAGFIFAFLLALAYLYRWTRKVDGLGGGDIWLLTGV
ncbi:MAG TPA: prepilin peptidase, partial [Candidatus Cloacimonadota bacterium]|nr:prepilin peptidase [Candidatus Cloacimonadota bacterium]